MSSHRLILLDCHHMCWKNSWAMGGLKHKGAATGVLFGFFRDLNTLEQELSSNRFIFCFDLGYGRRKKDLPGYKASRDLKKKHHTPEEAEAYHEMQTQINLLREEILPSLGYKNIMAQDGYEGDDHIATVANEVKKQPKAEAVIISTDGDLKQCLAPNVSMYHMTYKTFYTDTDFTRDTGLRPDQWPMVKAIGGCRSDEVPGVPGVGEVYAAKFIKGEMAKDSANYINIVNAKQMIKKNLPIVTLPYKGAVKCPTIQKDKLDAEQWNKIMKSFGISSLRNNPPKLKRRKRHG